jgi:hypothetical protein
VVFFNRAIDILFPFPMEEKEGLDRAVRADEALAMARFGLARPTKLSFTWAVAVLVVLLVVVLLLLLLLLLVLPLLLLLLPLPLPHEPPLPSPPPSLPTYSPLP